LRTPRTASPRTATKSTQARKLPKKLVPAASAREAAVVDAIAVYGVSTLSEAVAVLTEQIVAEPVNCDLEGLFAKLSAYDVDFSTSDPWVMISKGRQASDSNFRCRRHLP